MFSTTTAILILWISKWQMGVSSFAKYNHPTASYLDEKLSDYSTCRNIILKKCLLRRGWIRVPIPFLYKK